MLRTNFMAMKFVVTGMSGVISLSSSRSARSWSRKRVGGEPVEVELLRRVGEGRRGPRRQDLVPVAVVLAPERGAPRVVEPVERRCSGRAATHGTRRHSRRSSSARCARRARCSRARARVRDGCRIARARARTSRRECVAEHRRAGAPGLPAAGPQPDPVGAHGQHLGVLPGQPGRRRSGGGGQVDPHPARVQRVEGLVEPVEVEAPVGPGSSSAQEKMPTLTRSTPASLISRTSSAQVSRGHCSGL